MAESTSQARLDQLLPDWKAQLQLWAQNGSLVAAAQEALVLSGTPSALEALVGQWSAGDFSGLPPIVLLSAADISGAMGAYAISTGTIYLNADWLATASQDQANAVLTEELGHYLDGLLNAVDTAGDEGEYFSRLLITGQVSGSDLQRISVENDMLTASVRGQQVQAEAAAAPIIYGGSLYTIVSGASWANAEAQSVSAGGHLVAINNGAENAFLVSSFKDKNLSYYSGAGNQDTYWIGLTKSSGSWQWSDGTVPSYTNWGPKEPYEDSGSADRTEIVLEAYYNPDPQFWTNTAGNWNNNSDSLTPLGRYGIAEIPLFLSTTRTGTVKEGSAPFTTSINLSAGTQSSGNLAEGATVYWSISGITADDLASGSLTGSGTITNGKLDIQHSLKADADAGEQFSVSVYSDAARTQQIGATSSVVVDETNAFLRANSLYAIVNGLPWIQAEANAVSIGGHLASINDAGENNYLWDQLGIVAMYDDATKTTSLNGTPFWIGYSDQAQEGAWSWSNGDNTAFTHWHDDSSQGGQLSPNGGSAENYAYLGGYLDRSWDDQPNNFGHSGYVPEGIAEIPLTLSITRTGAVKEGAAPFITSINLSAGTQSSGNLAEGSTVYWSITGITSDDLASGSLTGSGSITNGKLDIQHSLKADADTGEQFSVSVYSDAARTQQIGTTSSTGVVESEPQPTPANPADDEYYTLDYTVDTYQIATTGKTNLAVLGTDKLKSWALWGDDQKNRLVGGSKDDFLIGGGDTDYLTGGPGADTFVMTDWERRRFDFITDFSAKDDVIGISKFMMDVSSDDSVEVVRYRDIKDQQTATETFDDAQADVYVFLGSTKQIQALRDKDWTQGLQLVIDSRRKVITYDSDGNWTTGAQTLAQFTGRFSTAWTGDNFLFGLDVPL